MDAVSALSAHLEAPLRRFVRERPHVWMTTADVVVGRCAQSLLSAFLLQNTWLTPSRTTVCELVADDMPFAASPTEAVASITLPKASSVLPDAF